MIRQYTSIGLGWKMSVLIVLLVTLGSAMGSWAYERAFAPPIRLIRDVCPPGLSGEELKGIQGMMPQVHTS
jgi:hypothetical protein